MRQNPYVGPRSFATGERLYGRDRELRKLANLLIAERIVLLYSPSGAGKTSLVQAALVPRLRDEGFQVLPPIRVGADPPPDLPGVNRYVLSALLGLEGRRPPESQLPLADLAALSLGQYLDGWADPAADGMVLIFDQFEEVLSVVPNDREAKEQFFEQLGAALRPHQRWALFSMREDYIAPLDPFLRAIPTRLSNRFRLDLLEANAAMVAMQAPARAAGVAFTNDAAQQLIDDLRMVRVQRPDGTAAQEPGLYVEPVQLQVVCYRIWAQLPDDDMEISLEDVARIGDVTTALRSYYAERVGAAAATVGVSERAVRDWFDIQLITAQGIRGQVLLERGASGGLDNRAIAALVDSHLVRGEQIRGATWYELSHDRLIEPVQADNAAWREANLSQLQRQSALWNAEGRQDGLLLRDNDLAAAEGWAEAHAAELTEVERDFLGRCRLVREIIRRERRNNRLIRILAVVSSLIGVVALILAGVAFQAKDEADRQARRAQAQALASAALNGENTHPERSLLLALKSQQIGVGLTQGEETLQQLLTTVGGRPEKLTISPTVATFSADGAWLALYGKPDSAETTPAQIIAQPTNGQGAPIRLTAPITGSLRVLALSPNGSLLVGATDAGDLLAWRITHPQDKPVSLRSGMGSYMPIIFSQDGALLAAGGVGGAVYIWHSDALDGSPQMLQCSTQPATALAISPDNQALVIGHLDGQLKRVALADASHQCAEALFHRHQERIAAIAFSPDGQLLVSGSTDGEVLVTSVKNPAEDKNAFHSHTSAITEILFSADGGRIISSSRDGTAQIWPPFGADKTALVLRGHEGWVLSASFSGGGAEAVTVGRDGTLRHWSAAHPAATTVIHQHSREVASVAYSPDGRWLAVGSIDKLVSLWAVSGDQVRRTQILTATSSIWWVAFSPDSSLLASANDDGRVQIWRVAAPNAPPVTIDAHLGTIAPAVAFSPDARYLASVGYDGALRLWDVAQFAATGQAPQVTGMPFPTKGQPLEAVTFSDDGRWLAAAGEAGKIQIWDMTNLAASPQELPEGAHRGTIYALAFRPGHPGQLAAAGFDAQIWLWDLAGADRSPRTFSGHNDWVIGLAFSPDGSRLASASNDKNVMLWNPDQPDAAPLVLRGHTADVVTVAFSPDGRWLASGSLDTTAIIWPLEIGTLIERACTTAGRSLTDSDVKSLGDQSSASDQTICPTVSLHR